MYCIFKAKIRLSLSKYAPRHGDDARCDEPEPVDVEVDVDRVPPQVRHRVRRPRRHRHSSCGRLVGARVVERDLKKDINLSDCLLAHWNGLLHNDYRRQDLLSQSQASGQSFSTWAPPPLLPHCFTRWMGGWINTRPLPYHVPQMYSKALLLGYLIQRARKICMWSALWDCNSLVACSAICSHSFRFLIFWYVLLEGGRPRCRSFIRFHASNAGGMVLRNRSLVRELRWPYLRDIPKSS